MLLEKCAPAQHNVEANYISINILEAELHLSRSAKNDKIIKNQNKIICMYCMTWLILCTISVRGMFSAGPY